jgi:DnaJ-class molecular chaperone
LSHIADNQQIKMAFKKLSVQFHPDKNTDNTLDKYQQIVQAYETLIDPELRQKYDFELA